jgi:anti-anti-sigma factor
MKVRSERLGSTLLLELEGRLTIEVDTQQLHAAVREVLQPDVNYLALDLAKVDQLDCSGIGLLVRLHDQIRESGRDLVLINVERRTRYMLQRAGLLAVFPVFKSLLDAAMCREPEGVPLCGELGGLLERDAPRHAGTSVLQLAR